MSTYHTHPSACLRKPAALGHRFSGLAACCTGGTPVASTCFHLCGASWAALVVAWIPQTPWGPANTPPSYGPPEWRSFSSIPAICYYLYATAVWLNRRVSFSMLSISEGGGGRNGVAIWREDLKCKCFILITYYKNSVVQ